MPENQVFGRAGDIQKTIILQSAKRKRAERSLISNQCAKLSNILQNSCRVLQKKKRLQELSMILIVTGFSLKMKVLFLDTTEKDMMKQL